MKTEIIGIIFNLLHELVSRSRSQEKEVETDLTPAVLGNSKKKCPKLPVLCNIKIRSARLGSMTAIASGFQQPVSSKSESEAGSGLINFKKICQLSIFPSLITVSSYYSCGLFQ